MQFSELMFDYHCSFIMFSRSKDRLDLGVRWLIFEEREGSVVKMSMENNNLLMLVKQVNWGPPRCGFDELGVYKLRRLFVDYTILFNSLRVLTIFNIFLVEFISQVENNLVWLFHCRPLYVLCSCFFKTVWKLVHMPVFFLLADPEEFLYFHDICHVN